MTVKKLSFVLAVILLATLTAAAANTIPAGTTITIRTGSTLDSGKVASGSNFDGTLTRDVKNGNTVVAKKGDSVQGRVVSAKDSGRLHKPGILRLAITSVNGIPVSTNSRTFQGKSHTKGNVTKIGVGTGAGALIGGLAGGGKGALIGAGAGAAAGTGVAYATGKEQEVVPAETTLTFTTR
jgi:hypothetical protein